MPSVIMSSNVIEWQENITVLHTCQMCCHVHCRTTSCWYYSTPRTLGHGYHSSWQKEYKTSELLLYFVKALHDNSIFPWQMSGHVQLKGITAKFYFVRPIHQAVTSINKSITNILDLSQARLEKRKPNLKAHTDTIIWAALGWSQKINFG